MNESGVQSARAVRSVGPSSPQSLLDRVKGEYYEMPGLRLSIRQASRLWGLDHTATGRLLDDLVETGFLKIALNGSFGRT